MVNITAWLRRILSVTQMNKDAGKFTKGEKKILYCSHQVPCSECTEAFGNAANEKDRQKD